MRKIILLIVILFFLQPCSGFCKNIIWMSYEEGVRLSQQQNKKMFIYFRTDWCGYCSKMDQQTFSDSRVIKMMNDFFIAVKIDGDEQTRIVKSYGVKGFPDNRFLDGNQKQIFHLPGFHQPDAFLFFLEYIRSDSYKTMTPMQYYKTL